MRKATWLVSTFCLGAAAACSGSSDARVLEPVEGGLAIEHVATDSTGARIVAGWFSDTIDLGDGPPVETVAQRDGFFASIERDGDVRWWRAFGGVLPLGVGRDDHVYDVAVLPDDSVVVTGYAEGTIDLGGGPLPGATDGNLNRGVLFVARYAADGAHLWSKRWQGRSFESAAASPTIGPDGSLYLLASFWEGASIDRLELTFGSHEIVLVKLSLDGVVQWARPLRPQPADPARDQGSYGAASIVARGDALLISGQGADGIDLGEGPTAGHVSFVMEVDPVDGERRALHVYPAAETAPGHRPMASGADGTLVLGGRHLTWLAPDLSIARSVDLGELLQFGGDTGDVAVTSTGEVVWVGWGAYVRFAADGSELARETLLPHDGVPGLEVQITDVAVDRDERVVLVGGFERAFSLGGQSFDRPRRTSGFIVTD